MDLHVFERTHLSNKQQADYDKQQEATNAKYFQRLDELDTVQLRERRAALGGHYLNLITLKDEHRPQAAFLSAANEPAKDGESRAQQIRADMAAWREQNAQRDHGREF